MKKTLLIILTTSTLLSGIVNANNDHIVMGTEGAYPPFNLIDKNGNVAGFDVEIGNALCKEMNAKCTWITSDWDGIIPALQAKKFDTIVASMSITEERKKKINFTNKYYTSPVAFIRRKGSSYEVTPSAIKNKVVGVQGGVVAESFLRGHFGNLVTIKSYKTQDEANLDLLNGRLDLVLADSTVLDGFLKTDKGTKIEFVGPVFDDKKFLGEGIGIGLRKEDTALRERLNAAIKAIRANGVYKKINQKYFTFDLYGN